MRRIGASVALVTLIASVAVPSGARPHGERTGDFVVVWVSAPAAGTQLAAAFEPSTGLLLFDCSRFVAAPGRPGGTLYASGRAFDGKYYVARAVHHGSQTGIGRFGIENVPQPAGPLCGAGDVATSAPCAAFEPAMRAGLVPQPALWWCGAAASLRGHLLGDDERAAVSPDPEPPDPDSPVAALGGVVEILEQIISETRDPDPKVVDGLKFTIEIQETWAGGQDESVGNLEVFISTLGETTAAAVDALVAARSGDDADPRLTEATTLLARALRWFAAGVIERAARGGVPSRLIDAARALWAEGDRLLGAGDHAGAVAKFGDAAGIGGELEFSLDLFEQNVNDGLAGQTVGHAFAISSNGLLARTGAAGSARTASDAPTTGQSATKEMNIASVSKTVTAVAVVQMLEEHGLTLDDPIGPWLPPHWTSQPSTAALTFRELMKHRSGLWDNLTSDDEVGLGTGYDALRVYIADGVDDDDKTFKYQNANYAMFRVLIPFMWDEAEQELATAVAFDQTWESLGFKGILTDQVTQSRYVQYVQEHVLGPSGITADCKPNDPAQTLLYRFPYDGSTGIKNGDWTPKCGSGGWYMSAQELAAFLAHQRFDDTVLSDDARKVMNLAKVGWMDPANYGFAQGTFGAYRMHGGDLSYGAAPPPEQKGLDTCVADFPNLVQASLVINSQGDAADYHVGDTHDLYQCSFLARAWEAAWVD